MLTSTKYLLFGTKVRILTQVVVGLRSALEALGWNVPEEVLLFPMLLTNLICATNALSEPLYTSSTSRAWMRFFASQFTCFTGPKQQ